MRVREIGSTANAASSQIWGRMAHGVCPVCRVVAACLSGISDNNALGNVSGVTVAVVDSVWANIVEWPVASHYCHGSAGTLMTMGLRGHCLLGRMVMVTSEDRNSAVIVGRFHAWLTLGRIDGNYVNERTAGTSVTNLIKVVVCAMAGAGCRWSPVGRSDGRIKSISGASSVEDLSRRNHLKRLSIIWPIDL